MKSNIRIILEFTFVLVLCYFPLCYRIDAKVVRQWDEARNAVHTIEIARNHNYVIRTYAGIPETWETKPPLLVWFQLISCRIFGFNELGLRFPSIVASFMTVLLMILFFFRFIGNRFTGYAAALVLVTSQGYLDNHIARTGDHDALLILITTAIILHVWLLLNAEKPKKKEFIFIGVLFAAGVLTKSIAVFFIVPGLLVSMLLFPGSLKIFTNKGLYIALAIFIFITAGYYVTREIMQPGYLKAVWEWELLPRYANSGNRFISASFWFYFSNLVKSRFTFWIWFLLPAMIIMPFILKDQNRRFFLFITINTVLFFLVISAGSKGVWYDGPLYPLFAIIISLTIINGYSAIGNNYPRVRIPVIISLGILYTILYRSAVVKIAYSQEWPWDAETFSMSYIIRNDQCIDTLPDPLKIVFKGYNGHFLFYTEVYEYKHNSKRFELNNIRQVKEGDTILISQPEVIDSLSKQYVCNIIWSKEPVKLVRVGTR